MAALSVALSVLVGTALGMLAAWRRGWVEVVIMRLVDTMLSIPAILLAVLTAEKLIRPVKGKQRVHELVPNSDTPFWRSSSQFFDQARSGDWRDLMGDDGIARYEAAVRATTDDEDLIVGLAVLLHDLGKAIEAEAGSSHALAGAALLRRLGEDARVVNAVAAHHRREREPGASAFENGHGNLMRSAQQKSGAFV